MRTYNMTIRKNWTAYPVQDKFHSKENCSMQDLNNKVIWLTGASSGIGEALANALAKEGAKLILSARREDELNRIGEKIKQNGADYLILPLDLADSSNFET